MNKNMISRWFSMYVLMMMFGIMGATAQSLSIADFAIRAGESKTITMNLAQGGQTVYGVQTDLTLPEGLTIEGEPAIVEGAITNGTLSKNLLTSGALRLINDDILVQLGKSSFDLFPHRVIDCYIFTINSEFHKSSSFIFI